LAARLQGWGGEDLLMSYGLERRPIFEETGRDFIAGRIEADSRFLDRYDPARDRAEFERAWQERADGMGERVLSYEPHYEGSPVILGPPGGKSSAHGTHSFVARAGHHLAPLPLSAGRKLADELGADFTLLAFGAEQHAVAQFEAAAQTLRVPLKIVRDNESDGREAGGAHLILVRPDQYVVWSADEAPGDVAAILGKAVGR
jgi:hypothetical protein